MARVEYKSTAPGVLLDRAGNARAGVTITHTGTAPFAASTGGAAYGGALTTNIDGEVPGWLDPGVYTMADPTTGKSWTFEVGGAATTSNTPTTTEKEALVGSSGSPSSSNKYVTDADARNSDARLPLHSVGFQAGVVGAGDLLVIQRAAGANQSVDVAAGEALVMETATSRLRYVKPAAANLPVGAPHATLPRIDKVYVTTAGALGYVEGTATSGATLDNMTGQPATPSDALLLEALLRPAATANVTTANMRNRRAWARGALARYLSTSDTLGSIGTGGAELTASRVRVECSGAPILFLARALGTQSSSLGGRVAIWMDAALITGASGGGSPLGTSVGTSTPLDRSLLIDGITAGTHLFSLGFYNGSGTGTFSVTGAATDPLGMNVREQLATVANN